MIVALLLMTATAGGAGWHAPNGWGLGLRQIERGAEVVPGSLLLGAVPLLAFRRRR